MCSPAKSIVLGESSRARNVSFRNVESKHFVAKSRPQHGVVPITAAKVQDPLRRRNVELPENLRDVPVWIPWAKLQTFDRFEVCVNRLRIDILVKVRLFSLLPLRQRFRPLEM